MRKKPSAPRVPRTRKSPASLVAAAPSEPGPSETHSELHRTTVSGVHQHRSAGAIQVPCIRIIGKWLESANFRKGDKVVIAVGDGELSLKRSE